MDVGIDNFQNEKVQRFEEFVDRRLKPDLVHAIAERDKVFEQQKVFSDLRRNIENLEKNSITNLTTLVNLGSEVYVQGNVADTRRIFVDVGLGFHVEFTWSEALKFISLKEERLARQIEEYTHLIASIKAQIKLVCEGIRELLQLPAEKTVEGHKLLRNLPVSPFFAMVCLGILFGCNSSRSSTDYLLSALLLIPILSSLRLLCSFLTRFLKRYRQRRYDPSPDPAIQLQPQISTPLPDNKLLASAALAHALPPLPAFSR
ncbi:Protein UXT-like protein, partial [Cucurbita argyrosperma subsp. sororia]